MRPLVRLTAAIGLVVAGALTGQAPATAASCADGVTVVVDFNQLGGGVEQACVPGSGTADDLFRAAGHTLQDVQQQPGFVCRVDSLPTEEDEACVRTPPANRYWGLWSSNGTSGSWTYAQQGAYSLQVPEGGSVGFSWNNSSTRSQPSATPPDQDGSGAGSGGGTGSGSGSGSGTGTGGSSGGAGGSGGGSATADPSPSSSPTATPEGRDGASARRGGGDRAERGGKAQRERDRAGDRREDAKQSKKKRDRDDEAGEPDESPSASPSSEPTAPEATSEPPATDDGGLPAWVAPTAIGVLFAAAGVAAYLRRRASGT